MADQDVIPIEATRTMGVHWLISRRMENSKGEGSFDPILL